MTCLSSASRMVMVAACLNAPAFCLPEDSPAPSMAFEARLAEVRKMAPQGFTVLAQPPFVVAGDETPALVRQRADRTIKYAVDRLKLDYFDRNPEDIISIWLFKDRISYETGTRKLFSEIHASPYGYYSPRHRALLMNISTGSGTLVHEIVHPFIRTNFPGCPPWFNEGLASLFEQSAERAGHIVGLTNWRLPGLQKLIREHHTLPFAQVFALDESTFYGATDGYNRYYGQARYLCYYLQEHDLLVRYYREFSTHAKDDPTGLHTLQRVLAENDISKFQARWESYVLGLHYP